MKEIKYDDTVYYTEGNDLRFVDSVRKALYKEQRLNGDQMRDLAHKLTYFLDHVFEWEGVR